MRYLGDKAMKRLVIGYTLLAVGMMASCTQQPQHVRRLSEQQTPDSAMMAQMEFNMQMASAADKRCSEWVKKDSAIYVLDDFGFWYSKIVNTYKEPIKAGDNTLIHIQLQDLSGTMIADIKDYFSIGSSDLPVAINRSLKMMANGEKMRIVAPWYTAYGAEGTTMIKPYSNLIITLTTIEE